MTEAERLSALLDQTVREREEYNGEAGCRAIQVKILQDALFAIRILANHPSHRDLALAKIFSAAGGALREAAAIAPAERGTL